MTIKVGRSDLKVSTPHNLDEKLVDLCGCNAKEMRQMIDGPVTPVTLATALLPFRRRDGPARARPAHRAVGRHRPGPQRRHRALRQGSEGATDGSGKAKARCPAQGRKARRARAAIDHARREYVLRPSVEAIMEAERETGLSLFDLASLAANGGCASSRWESVVAAFMRAHGKANPDDPLKTTISAPSRNAGRPHHGGGPRGSWARSRSCSRRGQRGIHFLGGTESGGDEVEGDPRRRLLGLCCALFHWTPDTFFRATFHEIYAAIEGYERSTATD
jgi:hypothetical protein